IPVGGVVFLAHPATQRRPLADQALVADVDDRVGLEGMGRRWGEEVAARRPERLDDGDEVGRRYFGDGCRIPQRDGPTPVTVGCPVAVGTRTKEDLWKAMLLRGETGETLVGMIGMRPVRLAVGWRLIVAAVAT